jgi:hypothetical protein
MSYTEVPITPGLGENVAADNIDNRLFQRMKLAVGGENVGVDVSDSNPMPIRAIGELIEAIEAQRMTLQSLVRSIGQTMPDTAGRLRVLVDSISASLTLATITTVGTVTTVSTLSNQTQIGGLAATEQIPSLMRLGADSARRNISVT